MTLTPVEIRHVKPSKAFIGGYDRDVIFRRWRSAACVPPNSSSEA